MLKPREPRLEKSRVNSRVSRVNSRVSRVNSRVRSIPYSSQPKTLTCFRTLTDLLNLVP